MVQAFLSIGANLGDRRNTCQQALDALDSSAGIQVVAVSGEYETEPMDKTDQPDFINLAVQVETELEPPALLRVCKDIEDHLGRVPGERYGPRLIDLDLLLFDRQVRRDEQLVLPHPRMHLRRFVLAPLFEIAPELLHPVLDKTVSQLLKDLGEEGGRVRRLDSHACQRNNPASTTEEESK